MKKYTLLIVMILILTLSACSSENNTNETVDEEAKEESSVDLASYIYTDYDAFDDQFGPFEELEETFALRMKGDKFYTNRVIEVSVNDEGKIEQINIVGTGNYNLFGLYYDMPVSEARPIIDRIASRIVEETDSSLKAEISDKNNIKHTLTYYTKNKNSFIDVIEYTES